MKTVKLTKSQLETLDYALDIFEADFSCGTKWSRKEQAEVQYFTPRERRLLAKIKRLRVTLGIGAK